MINKDKKAAFFFHDSLVDFLPVAKKGKWLTYTFAVSPSIKDAIEALGIPHPEVAVILVNGNPVLFSYLLQLGDKVAVYPSHSHILWPASSLIQKATPMPEGFILDVHLGKLAKALRLLGFDTAYQNDFTDAEIVHRSHIENRIVLTRDIGILKHKLVDWGYWLRSQWVAEQVTEVIRYFNLAYRFRPFARCIACNGIIEPVAKENVVDQVPPNAAKYFHQFYRCTHCHRIYWKGSHYEHMLQTIEAIQSSI